MILIMLKKKTEYFNAVLNNNIVFIFIPTKSDDTDFNDLSVIGTLRIAKLH